MDKNVNIGWRGLIIEDKYECSDTMDINVNIGWRGLII